MGMMKISNLQQQKKGSKQFIPFLASCMSIVCGFAQKASVNYNQLHCQ